MVGLLKDSKAGGAIRLILLVMAAGVSAFYPWLYPAPYYRFIGTLTVMYMALASAWNLMGGLTGYISLGHGAFFGLGAYFTAITASRWGAPVFAIAVIGGVFVAGIAALTGWIALKMRDSSFVIVTLALGFISGLVVTAWSGLTGGSAGISVRRLEGIDRDALHVPFYFAFLILLALILLVTFWIRRSKFGLGLLAIRDDEDKAQTLGVNTPVYKLAAFVLSAAFVGIAGGIYAFWFSFVQPQFTFSIIVAVNMIMMSLLGGTRTLFGPLLGALFLVQSNEYFLSRFGSSEIHLVFNGLLLLAIVLLLPQGLIPSFGLLWNRTSRWIRDGLHPVRERA